MLVEFLALVKTYNMREHLYSLYNDMECTICKNTHPKIHNYVRFHNNDDLNEIVCFECANNINEPKIGLGVNLHNFLLEKY